MTTSIYQETQLAQLPAGVLALKEKFPVLTVNLGEVWNLPEVQEKHPNFVEVFYGDDKPSIVFKDGKLIKCLSDASDDSLIAIYADDELVFVEYEGKQILDRMGVIELPEQLSNPVEMVQASIKEVQ